MIVVPYCIHRIYIFATLLKTILSHIGAASSCFCPFTKLWCLLHQLRKISSNRKTNFHDELAKEFTLINKAQMQIGVLMANPL